MTTDQRLASERVTERIAALHKEQPNASYGALALPAVRHTLILDRAYERYESEHQTDE
jgi:hypothetical protein